MELWRIHWINVGDGGLSAGYTYGRTKKEAIANGPGEDQGYKIGDESKSKVLVSSKGKIDALNKFASHPDNG